MRVLRSAAGGECVRQAVALGVDGSGDANFDKSFIIMAFAPTYLDASGSKGAAVVRETSFDT